MRTEPNSIYENVLPKEAEKAKMNDANKIITLIELQPSITRATYFP